MDLSLFCQSNTLYTQEELSRYRPGGYHPVKLGDTFQNGRYEIRHKLGWGGFSTVWLARDKLRDQWVSLKIMASRSQASQELQNLEHLQRHSRGTLASNYIVQLLDCFTHEGPIGVHQCLVSELLGPTVDKVLADYRWGNDKLDSETVLRMCTQLLTAVRFIHSAGMGHGDISGRNIAFTCTQLSNMTEEQLFEVLGVPEIAPLARIDGTPLENGLPSQLVKATEWTDWIDEDDEDIRLLDFGESFLQGEEPTRLAQPGILRVPETIFTDSFGYRVDLWRTGCMIYSFLLTNFPFWYLGKDEDLVLQMINFVETLPTEWESQWKSMKMNSLHDLEIEEDQYEKILSEEWEKLKPEDKITDRREQQSAIIERSLQKLDTEKSGVKEGVAKFAKCAQSVKEFVDAAVKASPEASLVWAGVCVALPLLTNPQAASDANKSGFHYVTSRLAYYLELEHLLWPVDGREEQQIAKLEIKFLDSWTELYKKLLEFQFESVIRIHSRHLAKDIFGLQDWEGMITSIKELEAMVDRDAQQINASLSRQDLEQIRTNSDGLIDSMREY
ncbi:uncharacterized protein LDX57_007024 [Aspergillus melleus]|uniref:uncharacterized protein n=1 Tax=Aspergillus melleus TaxID=138277 RepID=UPI001E8CCE2B|nr:uncharacterized protein LDX57_007024 [Aspergillus melleus]KAH8429360.1 hypothetical protein LDX57_007024 [Aspergillus melleus]